MSVGLVDWKFAGDESKHRCPDIGFDCIPPSACAVHNGTSRNYCCDAGGGCWNQGNPGDDEEVTKACSTSEEYKDWRCMKGSEECVRGGKINLCTLSRKEAKNPLPEIGNSVLQDLFDTWNATDPSEEYMSFDPSTLIAATQSSSSTAQTDATTSASIESTTADTVSTTGTATATATDAPDHGSALSGGAIGGIVAGSVAGVALLSLGAWFLWKKNRRPTVATVDYVDETKNDAGGYQQTRQVTELEARQVQEMP